MPDRGLTLVDGESHYLRTLDNWQLLHGETATLGQLRLKGAPDDFVVHHERSRILWTKVFSPEQPCVYITTVMGGRVEQHEAELRLSDFRVEPVVLIENKTQRNRRNNILDHSRLIEKPKGADASLLVRMLAGAFENRYDVLHLYTSDADFLPAIREVRRLYKPVFVYGYKDSLGDTSDLLTAPTVFTDLAEFLRNDCTCVQLEPR